MWSNLDKISEQVTKYSSFLGQLWYVLVFIFRLFVVATIGNTVYGDEQSAFRCSEELVGCTNMCYNEFAKISHIRFWAFQLLAVAAPTVFFHFYSTYAAGEIEKMKNSENEMVKHLEECRCSQPAWLGLSVCEQHIRKMAKRKESVGRLKIKQYYSGNGLKEVVYTNKIKRAYYISTVLTLIIEGLFIYLAWFLFYETSLSCLPSRSNCSKQPAALDFLWMKVPGIYYCFGKKGSDVQKACVQHMHSELGGFVPCYISRPFEKTVFLRYMMVLSVICFNVRALELLVALLMKIRKWHKRAKTNRNIRRSRYYTTRVLHSPSPQPSAPAKFYEESHLYPNLDVSARMEKDDNLKNWLQQQLARHPAEEEKSHKTTVKSYV